ncbi:MAG: GMC oxidoreductase [Desulfobacteraceae bacterium]
MNKKKLTYETEILVVGSGVGSLGLIPEFIKKNFNIIVVDKGNVNDIYTKNFKDRTNAIFKKNGRFPKSEEGLSYYYHNGIGGTLEVSCGNGVDPSRRNLECLGIDISGELTDVKSELLVNYTPVSHMGANTLSLISGAETIGYKMTSMPKFIDFDKCTRCAFCETFCPNAAKWSSKRVIEAYIDNKQIKFIPGVQIERIEIVGNTAQSAVGVLDGREIQINSDIIFITSGGLGSPVILQNSGIKSGRNLFLDLFVVVYAQDHGFELTRDIPMAAFYHDPDDAFIIASYMDIDLWQALVKHNMSKWLNKGNYNGLMVKIADEGSGRVLSDGSVKKKVTANDQNLLNKGVAIAKKILLASGGNPETLKVTDVKGAHPGGTAAIGQVVGPDLKVKGINNLFVADSSVFPLSFGKPPILQIMALAKKIAKSI